MCDLNLMCVFTHIAAVLQYIHSITCISNYEEIDICRLVCKNVIVKSRIIVCSEI